MGKTIFSMIYYKKRINNSISEDSNKLVMVIAMSVILAGALLPSAGVAYSQTIEQGPEEQPPQQQQPDQTQQETGGFIFDITTPIDTFTAEGKIGSLVFAVDETEEAQTTAPMPATDAGQQIDNDTTTTTNDIEPAQSIPTAIRPPFVLTGDWVLQAEGGTVTMFDAGFTMVRTDGTNYHTINLTNYQSTDEGPVTLGPTTERINGTIDVLANGTVLHESQNITITLGGLVMAVHFAEGDTRDHFKGLPVFGTISSVVSADGTTVVGVAESDVVMEEGPETTAADVPGTGDQQQPTNGDFTGDIRSPFEPYEGQLEERGIFSPRGPFDPVHPEEGNSVLDALRNPFGL